MNPLQLYQLTDAQIDAAIEALFPNDNHYHAEWMREIGRPIARAVLASAAAVTAGSAATAAYEELDDEQIAAFRRARLGRGA